MIKVDLVNAIAEDTEWTKKDSEIALDSVIKVFTDKLNAGEKITIVGFGTFEIVERAAREGRNPQTGETMKIEACKTVKFKPAKALKELVNGK